MSNLPILPKGITGAIPVPAEEPRTVLGPEAAQPGTLPQWADDSGQTLVMGEYSPEDFEPADPNLQAHLVNTANPHGVTAAQAGAAATSHTHAYADLPTIGGNSFLGNRTGGTAAVAEMTAAQAMSVLGAAASGHSHAQLHDRAHALLTVADHSDAAMLTAHARGQVIASLKALAATRSNVKALWLFDALTGTTVTDRSVGGNNLTLSADASGLTPGASGRLATSLTFASSAYYEAADDDDWDLSGPLPFTIIWAGALTDASLGNFLTARNIQTGANSRRWRFATDGSDRLIGVVYDDTSVGVRGRYASSAVTGDEGTYHVYQMVYDGGTTNGAVRLYRDGVQVDDTDTGSGTFSNITNTTQKPASYMVNADGSTKSEILRAKVCGVSFIKEAWDAEKSLAAAQILLGYMNNLT